MLTLAAVLALSVAPPPQEAPLQVMGQSQTALFAYQPDERAEHFRLWAFLFEPVTATDYTFDTGMTAYRADCDTGAVRAVRFVVFLKGEQVVDEVRDDLQERPNGALADAAQFACGRGAPGGASFADPQAVRTHMGR